MGRSSSSRSYSRQSSSGKSSSSHSNPTVTKSSVAPAAASTAAHSSTSKQSSSSPWLWGLFGYMLGHSNSHTVNHHHNQTISPANMAERCASLKQRQIEECEKSMDSDACKDLLESYNKCLEGHPI